MSLTKASYSMIQGAPINLLDYGADKTGATNCHDAFVAAIAATPIGGMLYIPVGTFKLTQRLTITKAINIVGEGVGSIILIDVGQTEVGIVFGVDTPSVYITGCNWKNFAILGGANSCFVGLLLLQVNTSFFENIHVRVGNPTNGVAVWIRFAVENYYNFIISSSITYGVTTGTPYNAVLCTSDLGAGQVCNSNFFNLNIIGATTGLTINTAGITDAGNNVISGTYIALTAWAIKLQTCKAAVIENCNLEDVGISGSNIILNTCIYIQIRGTNVYSNVLGFNDVQLQSCYATYIDGLRCNRLSIDAGSSNTYLLGVLYQGNTDAGLYNSGTLANEFVVPSWSIKGTTVGGTLVIQPDFEVDTTASSAQITFGRESGTAGDFTKFLFRDRVGGVIMTFGGQALQPYADNAAAIAAGLTVGSLYRIGDTVAIVH